MKTVRTNVGMAHHMIEQSAAAVRQGRQVKFISLEAGKGKTHLFRTITNHKAK